MAGGVNLSKTQPTPGNPFEDFVNWIAGKMAATGEPPPQLPPLRSVQPGSEVPQNNQGAEAYPQYMPTQPPVSGPPTRTPGPQPSPGMVPVDEPLPAAVQNASPAFQQQWQEMSDQVLPMTPSTPVSPFAGIKLPEAPSQPRMSAPSPVQPTQLDSRLVELLLGRDPMTPGAMPTLPLFSKMI